MATFASAVLVLSLLPTAAFAAAYAAQASLTPNHQYLGDTTLLTLTVRNTGTTRNIGAVQVKRPIGFWTVLACPSAPAGWTRIRTVGKCRYLSAAGGADDIKPGQSRTFTLRVRNAGGDRDRKGTWSVRVSRSNSFANATLVKAATPMEPGLQIKAFSFQILDAVIRSSAAPVGSACPAPNKGAITGSSGNYLIICGRNRTTQTRITKPKFARLDGTFVVDHGSFTGGAVAPSSTSRVLGYWRNVTVTDVPGSDYTVVARVGSWRARKSPWTTLSGYFTINTSPTDIELSNADVDENQTAGTVVGTLTTTDADVDDAHTYSLVAGTGATDNASFAIVGDELRTAAVLDHEAGATRSVRIRTTDLHGAFYEEAFTITVNDLNDAPTDITLVPSSVDENEATGSTVGALAATDQDAGDTHTFSLVAGAGDADNASFAIDGTTLETAETFDHEAKASYSIRVRADDGAGGTFEKALTVTIGDVNEEPTDLALSDTSVPENEPTGTVVGTFTTTDPDDGDSHTYTLVAGTGDTDNASFAIDGNALETAEEFDAETKSSYSIRVRTTDAGGLWFEKTFTITVDDANDAPTDISLDNADVDENQSSGTTVGTFSTTDADAADSHTYTLVAGTGDDDNASFSIDGDTLETAAVFDFETKASYSIRVRTSDGAATFEKVFVITVNDINDAPVADDDTFAIAENSPASTSVGTVSFSDQDSTDSHACAITGGNDGGAFAIDAGTCAITVTDAGPLDFETTPQFILQVQVTDDGTPPESDTALITIDLTNVNEAPEINLPAGPVTVIVNTPTPLAGISISDPDAGSADITAVFEVTNGTLDLADDVVGGVEGGDISGNGTTSVTVTTSQTQINATLANAAGLVYTPATDYTGADSLEVDTDDLGNTGSGGAQTDSATLAISVTPPNQAPTADSGSDSTDEDTPVTVTLSGSDDDGEALTFEIVAPPSDGTLGAIGTVNCDGMVPNSCTADVEYTPDPDFNGPDSFTYKANDGISDSNVATFDITVNAVNDAPVLANIEGTTIAYTEGDPATQVTATITISDVDSTTLAGATVSIGGGANGAVDVLAWTDTFADISGAYNSSTLVLTLSGTASLADYEAALRTVTYHNSSDNPTSTPTISFRVNDGAAANNLSNVVTRDISVTAVNDAPVVTAPATATIDEDTILNFTGGNAISIADADAASGSISVQLEVTNGTLTMTTLSGLAFTVGDGAADAAMSFSGTLANVNAALATLSFTPTANFPGAAASGTAAFSISVNDDGNTGSGGAQTDGAAFDITVNQVNDPPVGGADSAQTVPNVQLFYDVTPGAGVPATIKTTTSGNGVLDNDSDPVEGSPVSIIGIVGCGDVVAPFDCATTGGGEITLNADGTFTYRPDDGDTSADTFQYVLSDGTDSVNVIVDLAFVGSRIWFVKNNATAGGLGRSHDPFDTLAEADAAATASGDVVFVYFGDGTTNNQNSGFTFAALGQTLWGEGVALTTGGTVNGVVDATLVAAGSQPLIGNAAGNGVTALNHQFITIWGLSIAGSANAIEITTSASGSGGYVISDNTIRGAGAEGIELNHDAGTVGTITASITDNAWNTAGTHTGNAIDFNRVAGDLRLFVSGNSVLSTGGAGIAVAGGNVANTVIREFAGNSVNGDTAGAGVSISNVTFDASSDAATQQVDGDTLAIGASGNPVGGAGFSITSSQGNLFFDDLDIFAAVGTALNLTETGTGLTFGVLAAAPDGAGTSTLDADNGAGITAAGVTLSLLLADFDSTTTGAAITLDGVGNQFRAPAGSTISKTSGAGTAVSISNSSAPLVFNYAGTINVTSGAGIALSNNTGSTFNFTGTLTLSTGTSAAFAATGGGTVVVTGSSNTLTTTTATALNVANTTIGAGGLTFQSISSSGGTSTGIILSNTGTAAGLTVTGDGADTSVGGNSTGGTISGKSGADGSTTTGIGIYLNSTKNVVLRRMTIDGTNQNYGILGFGVDGFVLEYSTVGGTNGTAATLSAPNNYGEGAIYLGNATATGVVGTVTFTKNSISGGRARNLSIINTVAGTTTLTVKGNTFGAIQNFTDANASFAVEARVSSGVVINTQFGGVNAGEPNTLTSAVGDLVNFTGQQNTTMGVTMQNNTLSNNNPSNVIGGGSLTLATAGTMTFTVTGNTMRDANGSAVTLFKASALSGTPSMSGTFSNNIIGVLGTVDSGSKTGNGIFVSAGGAGTMSYTIRNNQIFQINGNAHIYADNTGGSYTANFTIEGNTLGGAQPPNWFAGIAITNGSPSSSDTINVCADIGSGGGGSANVLNLGGELGIIVGSSGAGAGHTFNLPGLATFTEAGIEAFLSGNNTGSFTADAYADSPATFGAFTGSGTTCLTP